MKKTCELERKEIHESEWSEHQERKTRFFTSLKLIKDIMLYRSHSNNHDKQNVNISCGFKFEFTEQKNLIRLLITPQVNFIQEV